MEGAPETGPVGIGRGRQLRGEDRCAREEPNVATDKDDLGRAIVISWKR